MEAPAATDGRKPAARPYRWNIGTGMTTRSGGQAEPVKAVHRVAEQLALVVDDDLGRAQAARGSDIQLRPGLPDFLGNAAVALVPADAQEVFRCLDPVRRRVLRCPPDGDAGFAKTRNRPSLRRFVLAGARQ